jgi:alkylation response protein AidB-like acyl-CoA dehydrogenase
MAEELPTTYGGARARPTKGVWNRSPMGPNRVFATHLWVRIISKSLAISTYGRAYRTYTIFEGTGEIQRLIVSRAISGVHIR